MKLGDMTIKQVAKYCESHACYVCQFLTETGKCLFHENAAEKWDLNMEAINIYAETDKGLTK